MGPSFASRHGPPHNLPPHALAKSTGTLRVRLAWGEASSQSSCSLFVLGRDQFIGRRDTASGLCKHRGSGMPTTYPPPARAAGPTACVDISPSVWRHRLKLSAPSRVSLSRAEPPALALPADPGQSQLEPDNHGYVAWALMGWEGKPSHPPT